MRLCKPVNFLPCFILPTVPCFCCTYYYQIIRSTSVYLSNSPSKKLKVADLDERAKIVDAICTRGFEMVALQVRYPSQQFFFDHLELNTNNKRRLSPS